MKASLIYCQATDGSFAHTLQNTPTLHLKSHRDTQVSFLHVYCQCCNLWVCVCVCPQIARKRHKVINTFKSPLGQTRPPPPLKHITLMPLSQIRRVLDLQDTEGNTATAHTLQNKDAAAHHFVCMSFQGVFSSCNTAQCWKPRQANSGRSHFPVCSFKNALRSESAAKHHLIPEVYFRRVPQQTWNSWKVWCHFGLSFDLRRAISCWFESCFSVSFETPKKRLKRKNLTGFLHNF